MGAGAHVPYGFPTGAELKKIILRITHADVRTDDQDMECSDAELKKFQYEFDRSGRASIDVFLQHKRRWNNVGRRCIAYAINKHEHLYSSNQTPGFRSDWFEWLFGELINPQSLGEFTENKLAFVTFNYDRLLEKMLYDALKFSFGADDEEVQTAMEAIPIIHIHGTIGRLPWQNQKGFELPFGRHPGFSNETHKSKYKEAANCIRLFHEDMPEADLPDLQKAQEVLSHAQLIKFLGFSYQKVNLDRLNLSRPFIYDRWITGTTLGMTGVEVDEVIETILLNSYNASYCGLSQSDNACLEHLRNCEFLRRVSRHW